jgi:hypothetical protein
MENQKIRWIPTKNWFQYENIKLYPNLHLKGQNQNQNESLYTAKPIKVEIDKNSLFSFKTLNEIRED